MSLERGVRSTMFLGGGGMSPNYTAVVQQHDDWWIGWIEEVPGVNSQGRSPEGLLDNLREALEEALQMEWVS